MLEAHQGEGYGAFALGERDVSTSEVLAESVHDDELELGEAFDHFFEHLVQQHLLGVVKNSDKLDLREDLFNRELFAVLFQQGRILINILQN